VKQRAPATMRTTIAATSMKKACWAKGADQVSWKPKRPTSTETMKPIFVEMAKPAPTMATQRLRTATMSTPMTTPTIDWRMNSGPMVGIWR
jgi:hypothetical protein